MLLIGMVMVAAAAILSVTTLVHPGSLLHSRLEFSTAGGVASHGTWGRTPAATENAAIANLFDLLLCGMGAVVAVAIVSLASLFAARESQRTVETVARRAVGASRRASPWEHYHRGVHSRVVRTISGAGAGVFASRRSIVSWPGNVGHPSIFPSIVGFGRPRSHNRSVCRAAVALRSQPFRDRYQLSCSARPPAFQLGLSLIVLTAAGLLTRQRTEAREQPAASAAGQVFRQLVDDSAPAARANRYGMLLDELDAGKRFDTVSLTATGGLVGLGTVAAVTTDCGQCSEGGIFLPWHVVPATHQFVSADSFHALGVRLLAGRGISRSDRWGATPVAVVSRSLAIRHFQRGEAIGRKILLGDDARTWHTVVGIVSDVPARGLGGSLQPVFAVYASVLQHPVPGVDLLIRAQGAAPIDATSVAAIHRELMLPRSAARLTESELAADELRPLQWFAGRIAFVGWATLALACCGTLSLIWLWVLSLQSELGLRRAVGARRRTCDRLCARSRVRRRLRRGGGRALVRAGGLGSSARRPRGFPSVGRRHAASVCADSPLRRPGRCPPIGSARDPSLSRQIAGVILTPTTLEGPTIRLEPLTLDHLDALLVVAEDPELWRLTVSVVTSRESLEEYVREALAEQQAGTALPFVTMLRATGQVIGSTRFGNAVPMHRRVEIGWTWVGRPWQRSGANREAKYLMLRHAFECWDCLRVEFKTSALNQRSRNALLGIGAVEEGILRHHMINADGSLRDSVYFSDPERGVAGCATATRGAARVMPSLEDR